MKLDLLTSLNPAQLQAVTFNNGNLLVLAGAGSGKTRVLVHRIAWLIQNGAESSEILAVTFTNKAAGEMRERLSQMLQAPQTHMWVGTFHGLAHRLLRLHFQEAGLPQAFQIMDSDDQTRLLKTIHKHFDLDPEKWPVKKSQGFINNNKEQGLRPNKIKPTDITEATLLRVYQAYEEACSNSGLVDFAELLLRSYELWLNNAELLKYYQRRFKHILVDEFQDTNFIQYSWIKALSSSESNLTAVGDDDQSIYSWRGADSGNMQKLKKDYDNFDIIKLEQNYRSTAVILDAANAVISRNTNRLGKNLWTESVEGELINVYSAYNETDEARYIVNKIKKWSSEGKDLKDIAILYRSNAQSRVIEEQLLYAGIPYRIYGGLKFFERAEIKDVLAYLRFMVNRNDDAAFERIINLPTRGIGEATLIVVRDYARANSCSLWQAANTLLADKLLSSRSINPITGFIQLINDLYPYIDKLEFSELIHFIINTTNLKLHYAKDTRERRQSQAENLDELITAAKQFAADFSSDFVTTNPRLTSEAQQSSGSYDKISLVNAFLANAALEAGGDSKNKESTNVVQLMTLHTAKGLEFPLVFLGGMEEGLFPHIMSMDTKKGLEEERRLCYVGMTRAKQKLYLLHAESRQLNGKTNFRRPSRFLQEIPEELIDTNSPAKTTARSVFASEAKQSSNNNDDFSASNSNTNSRLGQRVQHKIFGEGMIMGFEGEGEFMLVQVKFKQNGVKWLSCQYANLVPC